MPPKTRRRAAPPAQTTLSFKNKVTKTTQQQQESKKRLSDTVKEEIIEHVSTPEPQSQSEPEVASTEVEPEVEVEAEAATIQPKKKKRVSGTSTSVDSREAAAEKITDAQIKSYWRKEEESRLAPRVHQQTLPLHEKILRHFDLSGQFGSCIGITRLARWKRANRLNLEPPIEVLAVLLRELEGTTPDTSVATGNAKAKKGASAGKKGASGSRSQGCSMTAYIDELGGGAGRLGTVDA
ncbi:uncharacterized protein AB675_987 [Cyphellophora attinorum]|uniref:DNA polymerase delta subunit 4 n=1 Tax=Cyphellophora attinorum TaxID=1664694 RepID=A0A0N1H6Z6_9EURO|nr:uncharacterized protein AB675_987 [Phialophora attinorum]KPI38234.1 hypothetical protein AB675_987 [Phialophora attinorum]